MRWMIVCMCWLLLPLPAEAKCHLNTALSLRCKEPRDAPNELAPWGQLDDFFPSDGVDRTEHMHWAVERQPPTQDLRLPKIRLGNGLSVGYHRREVTVSQDCWHLTFRAFSKIALACQSTF